jgi:hypothetical protein
MKPWIWGLIFLGLGMCLLAYVTVIPLMRGGSITKPLFVSIERDSPDGRHSMLFGWSESVDCGSLGGGRNEFIGLYAADNQTGELCRLPIEFKNIYVYDMVIQWHGNGSARVRCQDCPKGNYEAMGVKVEVGKGK